MDHSTATPPTIQWFCYSGILSNVYSGWDASYTVVSASRARPVARSDTGLYLPLVLRHSGDATPVWFDDFSDYHTGWPVEDDSEYTFAYTAASIKLWARRRTVAVQVSPGEQMSDGVTLSACVFARGNRRRGRQRGIMFGQALDED